MVISGVGKTANRFSGGHCMNVGRFWERTSRGISVVRHPGEPGPGSTQ